MVDPEHGMVGRDARELLGVGAGANPVEEPADLEPPPPHVLAENRLFLGVGQLNGAKPLPPPPRYQLAGPGSPKVPDPVGLAARGNEVSVPAEGKHRDRTRRTSPLRRPRTSSTCSPETPIPTRASPRITGSKTRRSTHPGRR